MRFFVRSIKKLLILLMVKLLNLSFFFAIKSLIAKYILNFDLGKNVALHPNLYFYSRGNLKIGNNVTINYGCWLDNRGSIYIGDNVNISHCCKIYTMGHNVNSEHFEPVVKSVVIGNNVWIFPSVMIMPGVEIGDGAVIYPGTVVTKSVPNNSIVAGNPGVIVRARRMEPKYLINYKVWCAR